ncbi:MAG TPA: nucleoside-diphosphate kinase [Candidatus Saccharibacteria bacterium]|nr:nucleoside-diphosphate kinase [Candidatus Saccharibacteria bacterium]HMT39982.1 nucleoside-diphosphate kinase [Candidatus Saccharibacteria bacterium]
MNEKTLVVIKPDAMQRGIMGEIISRYEKVGLKIIGAKMIKVPKELADKHYPKDREEFIVGMGQKTLNSYKEQGLDPVEELGTDDPKEIGLKIQGWLVEFISESPVMALVLEGPHAIDVVRKITGFTLPAKADPGTIRGDFSFDSSAYANTAKRPIRNLIHASGDAEEAEFEINLWFSPDELYEYDAIHHKHMTQ